MKPNHHLKTLLALLCLGILGCGGIVDTIKLAIDGQSAEKSEQQSPKRQGPSSLSQPTIRAGAVVLMGASQRPVPIHASVNMDFDGDLEPQFGPVVKRLPSGTVGHIVEAYETAEWTYAIKAKFLDGTVGIVDIKSMGMIQRVRGVRSDDTLNVRSGRSHKRPKVSEIPPAGPVFVEGKKVMDMAGCEGQMSKTDKWWRVRTTGGVEGYVNCTYLGSF
jgi:hypothetical protein